MLSYFTLDRIESCQTYEGGFGATPFNEVNLNAFKRTIQLLADILTFYTYKGSWWLQFLWFSCFKTIRQGTSMQL